MPPTLLIVTAAIICLAVILGVIALRARAKRKRTAPTFSTTLPIRLTHHARERMQQRGVAQAELEAAVRSPDRVEHDPTQDSYRIEKDHRGHTLRVWVTQWPPVDEVVVKTTAWRYVETISLAKPAIGYLLDADPRGGRRVSAIERASNARIHLEREGSAQIVAGEPGEIDRARAMLREAESVAERAFAAVAEVGSIHEGRITKNLEHGALVTVDAGITGLIPEASLRLYAEGPFTTSAHVLPVGTRVRVRVHSFRDGKVQFSVMKPRAA